MAEFTLVELARRLENLIRIGTVEQIDPSAARVRVRMGNTLTAWIPWLTARAGTDIDWWAPAPGEQIILLSPSGDMSQAIALPSLYSDTHTPPSHDLDIRRVDFYGGTYFSYDRRKKHLHIDLSDEGTVTLIAKGGINLIGDVNVTGEVTANGIKLTQHRHTGVVPGGGQSGQPLP